MSTSKGRTEDATAWRVDLLEAILRLSAVVGPIVIAIGLVATGEHRFDPRFLLVLGAVLVLVALRFARALPFRPRAGLTVTMMLLAAIAWIGRSGFSLGAAAGGVTAIVLSVMLLGRKTGALLLLASVLAFAAIGAGVQTGAVVLRFEDSNPQRVSNWLRMAVSFPLLTGILAMAVDYVVRHVEAKYAELSGAYDELASLNRRLESAKEEERKLIARELHDDFGQSLTVLKLTLKTGKSTPFSDPVRVVDGLILKVRELSRSLRPALLDEVGLGPALDAYLEEQASVSGLHMELDAQGFEGRLAGELEIACFRIVQEAVTNALRHAEARHLTVRLRRGPDRLRLEVDDDGRGFAGLPALVRAAIEGHVGIIGMRERARALGGTFQVHSQPGKGTSIAVEMPLVQT